jgi:hypothetical protein
VRVAKRIDRQFPQGGQSQSQAAKALDGFVLPFCKPESPMGYNFKD